MFFFIAVERFGVLRADEARVLIKSPLAGPFELKLFSRVETESFGTQGNEVAFQPSIKRLDAGARDRCVERGLGFA